MNANNTKTISTFFFIKNLSLLYPLGKHDLITALKSSDKQPLFLYMQKSGVFQNNKNKYYV